VLRRFRVVDARHNGGNEEVQVRLSFRMFDGTLFACCVSTLEVLHRRRFPVAVTVWTRDDKIDRAGSVTSAVKDVSGCAMNTDG
jgi:hypothetical protein